MVVAVIPAVDQPSINAQPVVGNWPATRAAACPISLRDVRLAGFLGRHVNASNDSLLAGLESPLAKAIEARAAGTIPPPETKRLATDSDFYKWLEAACYALAYDPSRADLRVKINESADDLVRIQEPSGYIGTNLSPAAPFDEKTRHDLYVAGHFFEAAVAHFEATGDRRLLDAAVRFADFYLDAFNKGHPYFKLIGQEHPEIELALVRLSRASGQPRFLQFASDLTRKAILGPKLSDSRAGAGRLHAVRMGYQLTGAAEIALQTGDPRFKDPMMALWKEIIDTRMYVTGGIGYLEIIPDQPYDLPQTLDNPSRDIAETCASVALMMLSWRVHGLTGDSHPYDVIERILYNHFLGALSPDHKANFYYNPLRRVGDLQGKTDHGGSPTHRTRLPAIHSTACCLPNAWRFCAQLPEYVFTTAPKRVFVNLYTDASAKIRIEGADVHLVMKTRYPHDGRVEVTIELSQPVSFTLSARIPDWCQGATASVNSQPASPAPSGHYFDVTRSWTQGDRLLLTLPMPPRVWVGPPQIEANRGQVALCRGPLVYCLERQDAAGMDLEKVCLIGGPARIEQTTKAVWDENLVLYVLKAKALSKADSATAPSDALPSASTSSQVREIALMPFYYRANRADDNRWITLIPYSSN